VINIQFWDGARMNLNVCSKTPSKKKKKNRQRNLIGVQIEGSHNLCAISLMIW